MKLLAERTMFPDMQRKLGEDSYRIPLHIIFAE